MDAPCKIQGSIHVFRLVNNMCPGKWVHITRAASCCINGLDTSAAIVGIVPNVVSKPTQPAAIHTTLINSSPFFIK